VFDEFISVAINASF